MTQLIDLNLKDYKETWDYQEQLFEEVVEKKKQLDGNVPGYLILVEHPHVYTLGRSGDENNLLIQPEFLKSINATYYRINRGGDITYHGPGQLVGYPIIDLETYKLGVKDYIHLLEEVIIRTLLRFGIASTRFEGATGVWLDVGTPRARKICAIGVRISRYVSMHGFALNVNTDLKYFTYINPCGFHDKGVTSMQKELGKEIEMAEVKKIFIAEFENAFKA
ncbi:MAG TPA: lipoyl(octanoyl) transferase LipB [Bacteroidales bacterium]|nr:lipoyl(octanoyl) transferase LipB [Bacteroidales bacterium]